MEKYLAERPCRKCGNVVMYAESKYLYAVPIHETSWEIPERIKRTCVRCGFVWNEEPLEKG
jgi:endogenous inhibitor of DNA gyrase (YacG/DUF329 family)